MLESTFSSVFGTAESLVRGRLGGGLLALLRVLGGAGRGLRRCVHVPAQLLERTSW